MAVKKIYQLYAELCDYRPKIWRRFQLEPGVKMSRLAYVLMTLFEMRASHLFSIEVLDGENRHRRLKRAGQPAPRLTRAIRLQMRCYEIKHEDLPRFDDALDSEDATQGALKDGLLEPGDELLFNYDFGDDWVVRVALEEVLEEQISARELPRVLAGRGWGILEDCGGVAGLTEAAELLKKKEGPEYEDLCDWLGTTERDLAAFDIDDMNLRLKKLPAIFAKVYERRLPPTKRELDLITRAQ